MNQILRQFVSLRSVLLMILGVMHAVYVGRFYDVEPYLWIVSIFLGFQGLITLSFVRRAGHPVAQAESAQAGPAS